jgi:hypothetical protein
MYVQENQFCKVLIDAIRSVYGDRQEDDGVRPIRVRYTPCISDDNTVSLFWMPCSGYRHYRPEEDRLFLMKE